MFELTENFKSNIIYKYNEKGKIWIEEIPNILDNYSKKFSLTNIKLVDEIGINVVLSATSKIYGDIILKMGTPGKYAVSEINALLLYPKECIPKIYYYDMDNRTMIQERLKPGICLNELEGRENRVQTFCNLMNKITKPNNNDNANYTFKTYDNMFKECIKSCYENKDDFIDLIDLIDEAVNMYDIFSRKSFENYLLHDDFHNKNILLSGNTWKVIDPHGLIGPRVFDTPQFITSELKTSNIDEILEIALLLEKYLKIDKNDILKALYINTIVNLNFHILSNSDKDVITYKTNICKETLKYMNENLLY